MPKVVPAPKRLQPDHADILPACQLEQAVAAELPRQEEVREDDHRELGIILEHAAEHLGIVRRDAEVSHLALLTCLFEDLGDHVEGLAADHQQAIDVVLARPPGRAYRPPEVEHLGVVGPQPCLDVLHHAGGRQVLLVLLGHLLGPGGEADEPQLAACVLHRAIASP